MPTEQSLHEFVIAQLQESKGEWPVIAEAADVSIRTIQKIASRDIKDPGVSHIEKLAKYFRERAAA